MKTLPVCDICSEVIHDADKAWGYPCADYDFLTLHSETGERVGPVQRVGGGWLVCERCARVVESGSPKILACFVADRRASVRASKRKRAVFVAHLLKMYEKFYENRTGPRKRFDPTDKFEMAINHAALAGRCHMINPRGECDAIAAVEVHDTVRFSIKGLDWFPACFDCARLVLHLPADAEIPVDGVRARALTGIAPGVVPEAVVREGAK